MGDIIILPVLTRLDIPAERVIGMAQAAELANVVVLGYTKDGDEYFASSYADGGNVLWLMERLKKQLLEICG